MKPIFLIGFMGSGKTTLGEALRDRCGWQFIDLDRYIESTRRQTIAQIFATEGEAGFRQIESQALREVSRLSDVVIACGGGTPCRADNLELMLSQGLVVRLNASPARLFERLSVARAQRPLIARLSDEELRAYIDSALASRSRFYAKAHIDFCADYLDDQEQIDRSVDQFTDLISNHTI